MRNNRLTIPFKIDKNNQANLSTQLVDGFRRAILTGFYQPGDRLPSFSDIAMELGVSIRAPREAMRQLVAENLIRSRPRVGVRCWRVATASGKLVSFAHSSPPLKGRIIFR